MEAAVRLAGAAAAPGTTVLLAPAAASMDQFVDYADRGQRFAAAVNAWIDAGGAADGDTAPHPDGHADETHDGVDDGPGIAGH
jgi:UDP-N-acetylmuramoylalanine--D-glutamate ligase